MTNSIRERERERESEGKRERESDEGGEVERKGRWQGVERGRGKEKKNEKVAEWGGVNDELLFIK